ncbi:hypothetical protein A3Q29_09610 [Providencia stuartii]|uniref:Uncharacterized protein n=1 Tax=Providencia stuartii TaxID=588 RepID=A0A1S1HMW2_PROST|nr:hypothetical protein A3Q29_09610 [Providencia stuartii]
MKLLLNENSFLAALFPLNQPGNQLSGLAGEGIVGSHLKPQLLQPLTANGQLCARVGFTSVRQVIY